ncbi:hypothetical protein KUM42_00275 [Modestobacter sp. L9-4]|uniref:FtsX-like permease family protein n=1 Tax=Modestobacter sp. L9-4 TaxID=2851567 RepID=UPI001C788AFE|nr:FtsX-like permease family protein [Modestobacter sp. L9-4]QXG76057.1 hypothetical protein KUM42_00275 [Modestobacter sp. L9-4]
MLRLLVSDLVANARMWLAVLFVCLAAGGVVSVSAALVETAYRTPGTAGLALYGVGGSLTGFVVISIVVVLSSVARLTVTLQRRSHALWQLVGVRPGAIRLIVLAQLLVVGALGALLGCLVAAPFLQPFADYVLADAQGLGDVQLRIGPVGVAGTVALVALLVLAGGSGAARQASRVTGLELLSEAAVPRLTMTRTRWVVGGVLVAAVVSLVLGLPGRDLDQLSNPLMLIAPLLAGALVAAAPLLTPALARTWTRVVPADASSSWYLARNVALADLDRSTAAINPLVVMIALTGGLWSTHGTIAAAQVGRSGTPPADLPVSSLVLLLGGPLLLAAVGAATTVAVSGRARARDAALLESAGATPGLVVATAAWEAVVQVGTATLLALVAVATTAIAGAWAVGSWSLDPGALGLPALGVTAGATLLLVLTATVVPAVLRLRQDPVAVLSAQ